MKVKAEIRKCYYIAVIDENGVEVDSDFCFLDKKESQNQADKMLKKYLRERE